MSRRFTILFAFLAHAFAIGGLFTRIPDIQLALGLGEAALGLVTTALPVSALAMNLFAGRIIGASGTRAVIALGIPLVAIGAFGAALAPSLALLTAAFVVLGTAFSLANVAINVEADRVETANGRRVMSRSHGLWAAGMLASALIGAAARGAGVSAAAHLGAVVPLVLAGAALVLWRMDAVPEDRASAAPVRRLALPSGRMLILMLFGVSGSVGQVGTQTFSVIYLRDSFAAPAWLDTMVLPIYLAAMTLGRLWGDDWTERWGAARVAVVTTGLALVGAGLAAVAPSLWVALAGFALLGAGTGVHFPLMISAAAQSGGRAADNVSSLLLSMGVVMLVVPGALGLVAESFGVRMVFAALLAPLALSALLAPQLVRR